MSERPNRERLRQQIYRVVRQIPVGHVTTYGFVAQIVGRCTARMVGHALAALDVTNPALADVPWQRVINAQGRISPRGDGLSAERQRARLEEEGVHFSHSGRVDWAAVRWAGPSLAWLIENGFQNDVHVESSIEGHADDRDNEHVDHVDGSVDDEWLGYWEAEEALRRRIECTEK